MPTFNKFMTHNNKSWIFFSKISLFIYFFVTCKCKYVVTNSFRANIQDSLFDLLNLIFILLTECSNQFRNYDSCLHELFVLVCFLLVFTFGIGCWIWWARYTLHLYLKPILLKFSTVFLMPSASLTRIPIEEVEKHPELLSAYYLLQLLLS